MMNNLKKVSKMMNNLNSRQQRLKTSLLVFSKFRHFHFEKLYISRENSVVLPQQGLAAKRWQQCLKNMQQKFTLFIKSDKSRWTVNRIIYSIWFGCLAILIFKESFLQLEQNLFDRILVGIILLVMCIGLITKFKGFVEIEPLEGELDGYLTFEEDCIRVKDEMFPLETIRNLKIINNDYVGKLVGTSEGNFGPALSNGTNNYIVIFLESGKSRRIYFKLNNSNDFQNIRSTLIEYYIKRKIDIWELANALGEQNDSDFNNLKKDIENSTVANSGQKITAKF